MRTFFLLVGISLGSGCFSQPQGDKFNSVFQVEPADPFDPSGYLSEDSEGFSLKQSGAVVPVLVSPEDHAGVLKVSELFQSDIYHVLGAKPELLSTVGQLAKVIIIGSFDKSPIIRQLVSSGKLDGRQLEGRWEKFIITTIDQPFEGIDQALVIAGSDKRGTIYGMFDFSASMGVSPWYWWADVPVKTRGNVVVKPGIYTNGEPKVKYRGIFINDEAPALAGWAHEKFGGFNHLFYERVFELILRLKGNYLWPAMWGRAIYDDDPASPELANEYGVVIGTSHHEPLMRAHVEWSRYGKGPWNYEKNPEILEEFWRAGIRRMGDNESIVSLGMRGDGDEPMTEGTAIALLELIVEKQRAIIAEETGKPITETPQLWALYKEVQEYYDRGMRVPDDVTLLLCDDNWGNIRKLPDYGNTLRSGGYGIYYHFDYVGGPRNYKWLNTTQISRVWEQMNLAYEYGARQIWIVNVGDIKPMEYPISFFLDFAWDPTSISADWLPEYGKEWASRLFGAKYSKEIAAIIEGYTRINSNRKPELLSADTYSLIHFREWERVVDLYSRLQSQAESIADSLPSEYQSAYFQLVLFPVQACANLNRMYFAVAKNKFHHEQSRSATNRYSKQVDSLFNQDTRLSDQYHLLDDGKWNHQMSQTHIGYTGWQQPEKQVKPETKSYSPVNGAKPGIWVEGSELFWPKNTELSFPQFDSYNKQEYALEIFNQGNQPFDFQLVSNQKWITVSQKKGSVSLESRIWVSIDWTKVTGSETALLEVRVGKQTVEIKVPVVFTDSDLKPIINGFVSFEAADFSRKTESDVKWQEIPHLGRTSSAITTIPVTHSVLVPEGNSPHLEFDFYAVDTSAIEVAIYLSPVLNYHENEGRKLAVSLDDQSPVGVNVHEGTTNRDWNKWVSENVVSINCSLDLDRSGVHTLRYWAVDPGMVLQKVVIRQGSERTTYLGEPSTFLMTGK